MDCLDFSWKAPRPTPRNPHADIMLRALILVYTLCLGASHASPDGWREYDAGIAACRRGRNGRNGDAFHECVRTVRHSSPVFMEVERNLADAETNIREIRAQQAALRDHGGHGGGRRLKQVFVAAGLVELAAEVGAEVGTEAVAEAGAGAAAGLEAGAAEAGAGAAEAGAAEAGAGNAVEEAAAAEGEQAVTAEEADAIQDSVAELDDSSDSAISNVRRVLMNLRTSTETGEGPNFSALQGGRFVRMSQNTRELINNLRRWSRQRHLDRLTGRSVTRELRALIRKLLKLEDQSDAISESRGSLGGVSGSGGVSRSLLLEYSRAARDVVEGVKDLTSLT